MSRQEGRGSGARAEGNRPNRRARFDYRIEDTYEAGRAPGDPGEITPGRPRVADDGFAQISDGEVWLHNVHIPQYTEGTWTNHEPRRTRKLLLHRKEIEKLSSRTAEKG